LSRRSYFTDQLGYRRPKAVGFYKENGIVHPITPQGIHEHTPRYHPRTYKNPKQKEHLTFSPAVRQKYHEWHNEFEHARMEGRKRKNLPEGAFERYYRSRKAAFEATGGSATTFNDQFDKIDVAQAVDSWGDLDSELKANDIYATREDVAGLKRKAREEARENREIERSYAQYQKEQKKASAG